MARVLSNGLCSLKPQVDRLAMVCEMSIDASGGSLTRPFMGLDSLACTTHLYPGRYRVGEGWCEGVENDRLEDIFRLHRLYEVLRAARDRRGTIDFETVEADCFR